jgi:AcrR family transcriptional regulator
MPEPRSSPGQAPPPSPERERISRAVIDLVLERGYEATTVADLIDRAAVRPADFERCFAGREDCVLSVLDEGVARFRRIVFSAFEEHERWREGLRAAAYAAARWVRDNPRYILFSTMMMNGATPLARAHRDMALQMFTEIVDAGRAELDDPDSVAPETALTVIGSIYELLQRELARGNGTDAAESFVPQLMYIAVRPYLGHAEALKELGVPPPDEPAPR